jgi:hypothetical protein
MVETEEPTADPVVYDASMMPNWFSVSLTAVNWEFIKIVLM